MSTLLFGSNGKGCATITLTRTELPGSPQTTHSLKEAPDYPNRFGFREFAPRRHIMQAAGREITTHHDLPVLRPLFFAS
jgi:hypothetical protein